MRRLIFGRFTSQLYQVLTLQCQSSISREGSGNDKKWRWNGNQVTVAHFSTFRVRSFPSAAFVVYLVGLTTNRNRSSSGRLLKVTANRVRKCY
jgi:hypothetical protein